MTLPFHGDKPHMKTIDFAEGKASDLLFSEGA